MFRGVQHINMDAKGRLAMPTKHRDALNITDSGQLIATIDIHSRCLMIYPLSVWQATEEKLQKLPSLNRDARRLKRLMLGYASEIDMDASGRILLPTSLREYAELDKKLVLVGQGDKFELWGERQWLAETEEAINGANNGELTIPEDVQDLVL